MPEVVEKLAVQIAVWKKKKKKKTVWNYFLAWMQ